MECLRILIATLDNEDGKSRERGHRAGETDGCDARPDDRGGVSGERGGGAGFGAEVEGNYVEKRVEEL